MEEERRREEHVEFVSDPEEREPAEVLAEGEPKEADREVVLTGAPD